MSYYHYYKFLPLCKSIPIGKSIVCLHIHEIEECIFQSQDEIYVSNQAGYLLLRHQKQRMAQVYYKTLDFVQGRFWNASLVNSCLSRHLSQKCSEAFSTFKYWPIFRVKWEVRMVFSTSYKHFLKNIKRACSPLSKTPHQRKQRFASWCTCWETFFLQSNETISLQASAYF